MLGRTVQLLGYDPPSYAPAYVVWFDEGTLLENLLQLAAEKFKCPACGRPWRLARTGGCIDHVSQDARYTRVSDSCSGGWTEENPVNDCASRLYLDIMPEAERASQRWTKCFVPDRPGGLWLPPSVREAR